MTPDDTTPTPPAPTPTLPPAVREAIAAEIYGTPYASLQASDRLSVDFACSALAPLWPRPAPVTADALRLAGGIYGILINKHDEVIHQPETGKVKVAAVLAPVLARAEAAEAKLAETVRERDELRAEVERVSLWAEMTPDERESAEVARLHAALSAVGRERDDLRAQLAAALADKERLDWLLRPAEHAESKLSVAVFRNNVGAGWITTRAAIDAARREGGRHD